MPPLVRLEDDVLDLLASPRHQALARGNAQRLDPVRNMAEDDFAEETLSPAAFALWRAAADVEPIEPVDIDRDSWEDRLARCEFPLGNVVAEVALYDRDLRAWKADHRHPDDTRIWASGTFGSLGEAVAFLARQLDAQARTSRNEALSKT